MDNINSENIESLGRFIKRRFTELNLKEFYPIAGEIALSDIQEYIFPTLGALGSVESADGKNIKWEPLKAGTIEQRKRKGYWPGMLLQRRAGSAGLVGSIFRRNEPDGVSISTNLRYAKLQHYGGEIDHPGGTAYIMTNQGIKFISNKKAEQLRNPKPSKKTGKNPLTKKSGFRFIGNILRTKPHKITVPARPFLFLSARGMNEMKAEFIIWASKKLA